ncbi:MAG: hypothetical protein DHS80DRAFT_28863 [Piptocephalis tieghemiana]|nr:MAG: hypothetical protein DHS80DRAFT_28863 [Piptocephalis tieghemiana]
MLYPTRLALFLVLLNFSDTLTTAQSNSPSWGISSDPISSRESTFSEGRRTPPQAHQSLSRPLHPKSPSGRLHRGERRVRVVRHRIRSGQRRTSPPPPHPPPSFHPVPHHPSPPPHPRPPTSRGRLGTAAAGGALAGGAAALALAGATSSPSGSSSPTTSSPPPSPPASAGDGAAPGAPFAPVPPPVQSQSPSPSGTTPAPGPSSPATPSPSPSTPVVVDSAASGPQALPDQLTLMVAWTGAMVVSYLSFF